MNQIGKNVDTDELKRRLMEADHIIENVDTNELKRRLMNDLNKTLANFGDELDYEISSVNNEPNVGVKLETPSERIVIDINIK